jgi:hypothetical protein
VSAGGPALAFRLDSHVVDWRAMQDDERGSDGGTPGVELSDVELSDVELPEFDEFHRLLASVEELRALLALLSDEGSPARPRPRALAAA